jgi:hypothetical protein
VTGTGRLVCETGVRVQGVVGASVAGVHALGATSRFGGVTVGLGSAQTGCEGVVGLSGKRGAGLGLAKGDGGLLDPLGHPFALGLRSEAGECDSLALCAVSPVIEFVVGL